MTDRELMQQALEALEELQKTYARFYYTQRLKKGDEAITALRERLAQPEQDVWQWEEIYKDNVLVERRMKRGPDCGWEPWHTPRREWVGLTDDEIAVICGECAASAHRTDDISYARAIEAKLKEKNA